jgi:predicted nucleic acid-binding protein
MQRIFVDTGGWYAAMVLKDYSHEKAKQFLENNTLPLITSDYVMDETVTLLQSRTNHHHAVSFLNVLQNSRKIQLLYLTPEQITKTINLFCSRKDKSWSFTDCSSFILMQEHHIHTAFAFDEHFQPAGFQTQPVI